jgi:thiamine-monophosphate kinase
VSGEFERIAEIRRRLGVSGEPAGVLVGNGDDAAVLAGSARPLVLSVDAQVEGVHFRRELLAAEDIGHRALSAALSDLAAMGARPRAALLALVVPASWDDASLFAIADGMAEAASQYGCPVVGGNLARGGELSLTTTVIGECDGPVLTRRGAREGDALFIAGELGGAALGLRALIAGEGELVPQAVRCWRRPLARIDESRAIASKASAAIDVSDGLLQDLEHLADASGVGFEVELERLPLAPELAAHAARFGSDARSLALAGGEEYALLYTAAADTRMPGKRVGRACAERGVRLRCANGELVAPPLMPGFDHFPKARQPR